MRGLERAKYQAKRSFQRRIAEKETHNPAIIAKVGNGAGTVVVPGRAGWIYIRLHGDDNQLTEAKLGIPLATASLNDAWIRVKKASPRKASYYVVEEFITSSTGNPAPPMSSHPLDPDDGPHTGMLSEDDIADGSILARVASDEAITGDWNFNAGEMGLPKGTSFPTTPDEGDIFYRSDQDKLYYYDGSAWQEVGVGGIFGIQWHVDGPLAVATEVGEARIVPCDLTSVKVYIYCKSPGLSGSTIVDVNKNGTTIFTTQANRPTLPYNDPDKKAVSGTPDVTSLAEGDILTIDVDEAASGAEDLTVLLIVDGAGGGAGGGEDAGEGPEDLYFSTSGSDETGDGTEGNPYRTLAKCVETLSEHLATTHTIHGAAGTYAEPIDFRKFRCSSKGGKVVLVGAATCAFTGTLSFDGTTTGLAVGRDAIVDLDTIRVDVTADAGMVIEGRCHFVGNIEVQGTLTRGVVVRKGGRLDKCGNSTTIQNFSTAGIGVYTGTVIFQGSTTIAGNTTDWPYGIDLVYHAGMRMAANATITITEVSDGIHVAINSYINVWNVSGASITIDNSSTPAGSRGIYAGDLSDFGINCSITLDHFSVGFKAESMSYIEASGTRTLTNVGVTSESTQNSYVYLP